MIQATLFNKGKLEQVTSTVFNQCKHAYISSHLQKHRKRQNKKCKTKHSKNMIFQIVQFTKFKNTQFKHATKIQYIAQSVKSRFKN
jgi:hypothetical protein